MNENYANPFDRLAYRIISTEIKGKETIIKSARIYDENGKRKTKILEKDIVEFSMKTDCKK